MTTHRIRSTTGPGARCALLPRPGGGGARADADLRPQLAARGTRLAAAQPRRLPHGARPALSPCSCCATERRRAARLPQRLPPPRLAPPERLGAVRQGDPLPLPRLDLPPRRRADRRARGALDRRPRQVELGLFPARVETLCGLVFVNLDIHAQPLAEQVAGLAGAPRALRHRGAEAERRVAQHAAGELEDRRSTTTTRATTCRSPTPG